MATFRVYKSSGVPVSQPGAISFVRENPLDTFVKAFVADASGVPLPVVAFATNIIWLGAGDSFPASPESGTIYISTSLKTLWFVDPQGNILVLPVPEGSVLANIYYAEAAAPVTAVGTTPVSMLTLSEVFDPGIYIVDVMYGWACDDGSQDFVANIFVDGVQVGEPHQQEPKDVGGSSAFIGTNQRHFDARRFIVDFSAGGSHDIEIQFNGSSGGVDVAMFDTTIVAWNATSLA